MILIVALTLAMTPAAFGAQTTIPILAYHQVQDVPELGWSVSTEDFNAEMEFLKASGFHVIAIADLDDYKSGRRASLPSNPIVITVDDGFEDAYTNIAPTLKRLPMTSDTTLSHFAEAVGCAPLELREVKPARDSVSVTFEVAAKVSHVSDLVPSSVRIVLLPQYLSGRYDPATGQLRLPLRGSTHDRQTAVVIAERALDGHIVSTTWTFFRSASARARYTEMTKRLINLPLHHTETKRN
jgi:hypothetical protein